MVACAGVAVASDKNGVVIDCSQAEIIRGEAYAWKVERIYKVVPSDGFYVWSSGDRKWQRWEHEFCERDMELENKFTDEKYLVTCGDSDGTTGLIMWRHDGWAKAFKTEDHAEKYQMNLTCNLAEDPALLPPSKPKF